jgi:uncharacterized 2Fe-2S/4Fe-4S cluster protein (DUF4445 family)
VRVVEGANPPNDSEQAIFDSGELAAGWRLGCQLTLEGAATVEIPAVTRSLAGKSFGGDLGPVDLARPVVYAGKVPTPLMSAAPGAPSILDAVARFAGLADRSLEASPEVIARLAAIGSSDGLVRVVIQGRELVDADDRSTGAPLGLAIDLGTTSLAAALVSLEDGRVVASASALNPQIAYGADVISRIRHETHVPGGAGHLTAAARSGLASLVQELLASAGRVPDDVVIASAAGNPTMMHAWLGVSAASLGRAPYAGAWCEALRVKAERAGLPIHPNAVVLVFPLVKSHVGGDAVAAAIAAGLDRSHGSRLLIDVGTNTELLLAHAGRVFATSGAAGPAFEGVSIRHGMRAAHGAIDVVSFGLDGRVATNTIGGGAARGICGSGLIDAIAELLRFGIVSSSGYLRRAEELPPSFPLTARLAQADGVQAFTLVSAESSAPGVGAVMITARDIRQVQLAKGAILAAATLLCREAGIEPAALDEVLVAGAFGNYIRKASALRLGLLPPVDPERVRLVGNAAGIGARLALVDREVLARARALAARTEYLDLATDPDYQAVFMRALAFPAR